MVKKDTRINLNHTNTEMSTTNNNSTYDNKNHNIEDINLLVKLGNVIGVLSHDAEDFLKDNLNEEIDVEGIIKKRNEAKVSKDYFTADKLRNDLLENNILIEDTPSGTVWRRK